MCFLDQFQLDQIINTCLDHIKLCFYDLSIMCHRKLYSLFFIYFIFDNILIEHNLVFSKALLYFVKANIFTQ